MTKARRLEGPSAPLFFSAAVTFLLLLSAKITTAQTVDLSALELCAGLETQDLKLACFEAIINTGNLPEEQVPEIAVEGVPENVPAAVEPTVAIAAAPENAPAAVEPEPDMAASQVAIEATAVVSATTSDDDFGREQLAAPDQEEEKELIKAVVVEVTQGYNKSLYFHLANGNVWRQIEPRHLQYPKSGDFEVSISRGVMGEYRLRIGDSGRMTRIRRVE